MMTYSYQSYWRFLVQYLRPLRAKVLVLALLIFASIGLQLLNPQIIRYFIDTALAAGTGTAHATTTNLLLAAILFFVTTLLLQGVTVAATYVGEDVGWRATNGLRNELARHVLGLDMGFHNSHTPGELIERLDGDVAEIAIFFAQFVLRVLGNLQLLVGVIAVLFTVDWRVSVVLSGYAVICLFCFVYMRRRATPVWEATRQTSADLFGFFEEHLSGLEDLRSSGATGYSLRTLFQLSKARLTRELRSGNMELTFWNSWQFLNLIGLLIAFGFAYTLFTGGAITLGTVYLIIWYTDRLLRPLDEITTQFQNAQKAVAGINRVFALAALTSNIPDSGTQALSTGVPALTFAGVTLSAW